MKKKPKIFKSGPFQIRVEFKKAYITADGAIGRVTFSDSEGHIVEMTFPQAVVFAEEILRRCQ